MNVIRTIWTLGVDVSVAFYEPFIDLLGSSPRSLTPPPGDRTAAGNNEKPAKKGWFSFTSSAPSKKTPVSAEPPVEVAKEVEPDLPLVDQILGSAKRPTYRIDFQVQVNVVLIFLKKVL